MSQTVHPWQSQCLSDIEVLVASEIPWPRSRIIGQKQGWSPAMSDQRNSRAGVQPWSSTCLSSSCWYLQESSQWESHGQGNDSYTLFALCMEVDPGDRSLYLVKTNVVETLETRARYCPHAMVGNKEVFLPPHKYMITLCEIPVGKIRFLCLSG